MRFVDFNFRSIRHAVFFAMLQPLSHSLIFHADKGSSERLKTDSQVTMSSSNLLESYKVIHWTKKKPWFRNVHRNGILITLWIFVFFAFFIQPTFFIQPIAFFKEFSHWSLSNFQQKVRSGTDLKCTQHRRSIFALKFFITTLVQIARTVLSCITWIGLIPDQKPYWSFAAAFIFMHQCFFCEGEVLVGTF